MNIDDLDLDVDFAAETPAPTPNAKPDLKVVKGGKSDGTVRKGEAEAQTIEGPIKLVDLSVQSFARISDLFVNFNDLGITAFGGKNRAGKTSLMTAIKVVLGGKKFVPETPVHNDDPNSVIVAHFEDEATGKKYALKRIITPDRSCTLELTRPDGSIIQRGQEFLDAITGKSYADPIAFADADEATQLNIIKQWVGLETEDLDREEEAAYRERENYYKEVRRLRGHAESLPPYFDDAPETEVTATELTAEWNEAVAYNKDVADKKSKLAQGETSLSQMRAEPDRIRASYNAVISEQKSTITSIDHQIEALQARRAECEKAITAAEAAIKTECADSDKKIAEYEEKVKAAREAWSTLKEKNVDAIAERMTEVEETNKKVAANKALREAQSEAKAAQEYYDGELTYAVEKPRTERRKRIAGVKMPIPALRFEVTENDGRDIVQLYYGKLPFKAAAESEKYRVGLIMACMLNAKMPFCIVDNGESMDTDTLAECNQVIESIGGQLVMARVTGAVAPECRYIIEDGVAVEKGKK